MELSLGFLRERTRCFEEQGSLKHRRNRQLPVANMAWRGLVQGYTLSFAASSASAQSSSLSSRAPPLTTHLHHHHPPDQPHHPPASSAPPSSIRASHQPPVYTPESSPSAVPHLRRPALATRNYQLLEFGATCSFTATRPYFFSLHSSSPRIPDLYLHHVGRSQQGRSRADVQTPLF